MRLVARRRVPIFHKLAQALKREQNNELSQLVYGQVLLCGKSLRIQLFHSFGEYLAVEVEADLVDGAGLFFA